MKKIFPVLFFLLHSTAWSQTRSALFIGNSYTSVNNLPAEVFYIAQSLGDSLIFDASVQGGFNFQQHSVYPSTLAKISSKQWDYVILQDQSQEPAFPPSQVQSDVYPYATRLDSLIKANDSCSETVFFMTWGRKNGDASNCPSYPPICTYAGMQQRLRESYLEMGQMNNATVAPVGMAWKKIIADSLSFDLFQPDESHPSVYGTYLTACVFYAVVFQKSPLGATYFSSLPDSVAQLLQLTAHSVVFDSLGLWFETGYVLFSDFNYIQNGTDIQFQFAGLNGLQFHWDFGDGSSSSIENPDHIFVPGVYTVTLVADGWCSSDTVIKEITVIPSANNSIYSDAGSVLFFANDKLYFTAPQFSFLEIYDLAGKKIASYPATETAALQTISVTLEGGIYIAVVVSKGQVLQRNKFLVPSF